METDGFASFSGSDLTIEGEPEIIVDPATKEFTQEIVVTNSGLHPLPLNELIISSYSFGEGKNYEITIDGKTIEEFVIESENIFMPGESYTVTVKGLYNGEEKLNLRIGQIMSYLGDSVKLTNQSEGFYSYDFIYTESTLAIEEPTIEEEAVTQETNDEPIQTAQNMEGAQVLATGVDDFIPLAIVIVTTLLGIIIRLRFVNSK